MMPPAVVRIKPPAKQTKKPVVVKSNYNNDDINNNNETHEQRYVINNNNLTVSSGGGPGGTSSGMNKQHKITTTTVATTLTATARVTATPKKNRTEELIKEDKIEVCQWINKSKQDDTRDFKIGKKRRHALHQLCRDLMESNDGLKVNHTSASAARSRTLTIEIISKPVSPLNLLGSTITPSTATSTATSIATSTATSTAKAATTTTETTTTQSTTGSITSTIRPIGVIVPINDDILADMKIPQLKEELKLRNETVSGNKDVLRERLRAALSKPKFTEQELVLVRKAKKTEELRWQDSDAKQILSILLKDKNSWVNEIIDSDSTFSVPRSRSTSKTIAKIHGRNESFRPFVITNFITNFKNLKLSIDTEAKNAAFDQISYEKEIRKYPIQEMLKCGYPRWNHPNNLATTKLLEEDTKPGGFYLKPKELKASRAEYNRFPDQIFRNRFYKAKTAHKEKPYWQNERNKSMRNKRVIEENML